MSREGWAVNHKHIYRLYCEAELWGTDQTTPEAGGGDPGSGPRAECAGAMLEYGFCDGPAHKWAGVSGPDRGG